jgi:hypothetical protein
MRFFKGITALDYSERKSASLQIEGGTIGIIRRIELIPGKLLPSRACFRLAQHRNIQNQVLYLQPVEKASHLLKEAFLGQTLNAFNRCY